MPSSRPTHSIVSRDKNSLLNNQPSNYSQDGPTDGFWSEAHSFSPLRRNVGSIRVGHLNVHSIYSTARDPGLDQFLAAAQEIDLDVIALSETWLNGAATRKLESHSVITSRSYVLRTCCPRTPGERSAVWQGRGVAVLIKADLACHIGETRRIPGRGIRILLHFQGHTIAIYSIYAPSAPNGTGAAEIADLFLG